LFEPPNMLAKSKDEDQKKRWYIAGGAALVVAVVGLFVYKNHVNENRAAQIRRVAEAVSAGNPRALGSAPGQVSPDLLQAVGEDPPSEQPQVVQEALRELDTAIVGVVYELHEKPDFSPGYRDDLNALLSVSGTSWVPGEIRWKDKFEPHLTHRSAFLTQWILKSGEPAGLQLERLSPALRSASKMGDQIFAEALFVKKLELWEALFQVAGRDVINRIKAARELIPSAQAEPDKPFRLRGLKFLGARIIGALMDGGEDSIVNLALVKLRPNLAGLQEGGLRFEVVLSSMASCKSGEECKSFRGHLHQVLDQLRAKTQERQPILETTLRELFQNLSTGEKRKVWESLFDEMEKAYLFTGQPDAWPADLKPLPARAHRALNGNTEKISGLLEEFLERVAWVPIYEIEVRYLLTAVQASWARYRLIENCQASLSLLERRRFPVNRFHFKIISRDLSGADGGRSFAWEALPDPTSALATEAEQIYGRIEMFRRRGLTEPARSELMDYLKTRFKGPCRALAGTRPELCNRYE
jgi:hypothetical protein